jgi:dihydroxyacetone kinase-like protein
VADTFYNKDGNKILLKVVSAVQQNKDYLSEIDGLIGDGDHGINMNKGFTMFGTQIAGKTVSFTGGLDELGNLLFSRIGGSMGPIYGTFFMGMAEAGEKFDAIDAAGFAAMLDGGIKGLQEVIESKVGDKTLMDTLLPAGDALRQAVAGGVSLAEALKAMKAAAEAGRDSTKDLAARFGRSARLGERSRGVLDAGAVSCCLILAAMADGIMEEL